MKGISLTKAERLARTSGLKGWIAMFTLLGIMCYDQFILEIPFANVVFPILIICAASMNPAKTQSLSLRIQLYSNSVASLGSLPSFTEFNGGFSKLQSAIRCRLFATTFSTANTRI